MSSSAKYDLAQYLEALVLTFHMCVRKNFQAKRSMGILITEQDEADRLKYICLNEIFYNSHVYRNNLGLQTWRLNFNHVVTQWGYMYVYMCRHSHLVYHVMTEALKAKFIVIDPSVSNSVCAIGGGPGSDVLGLLMFFRENGILYPFWEINIFDRCLAWEHSWVSLRNKLPHEMQDALQQSRYHFFDFFNDSLTEAQVDVIKRSSFITLIKAISTVDAWLKNKQIAFAHHKGQRVIRKWHSVYSILQCVQPRTIVVFIDNGRSKRHRQIILDSALPLGFRIIYDKNLNSVHMPCDFFSENCKNLMRYLDFSPCSVSGENDALVLWKPPVSS